MTLEPYGEAAACKAVEEGSTPTSVSFQAAPGNDLPHPAACRGVPHSNSSTSPLLFAWNGSLHKAARLPGWITSLLLIGVRKDMWVRVPPAPRGAVAELADAPNLTTSRRAVLPFSGLFTGY